MFLSDENETSFFVQWAHQTLDRGMRSHRRALFATSMNDDDWEKACVAHGFERPDKEDWEWRAELIEIGKRLRE